MTIDIIWEAEPMNIGLSTKDILQVAENVEQREMEFYMRASKQLKDADLQGLCWKLAAWNLRHKKIWERKRQRMGRHRQEAASESVFSHPGAMAGLTWFGLRASLDKRARMWTSREYLLWETRQRVNDLMTFYEGLKGFVADMDAFRMVDRILKEEHRHFAYIERLLLQNADVNDACQRAQKTASI